MRKRIIVLTLTITLVLLISLGTAASGSSHAALQIYFYTLDGIEYYISGGEAYVTDYIGLKKSLKIPKTLLGCYVVSVELVDYMGTSLNLSECTKLRSLYADDLYIKNLTLTKCLVLENLTIVRSGISSVNVSACTKLKTILIDSQNLKSLNVSKNVKLTSLKLYHTPITTLSLTKNVSLSALVLEQTNLKTLNLSANKLLKDVSIASNPYLETVSVNIKAPAVKALRWS